MTAARVIFGSGSSKGAGALAAGLGRRAFVVTGSDPSRAAAILASLRDAGLACAAHPTSGEPGFASVELALAAARDWGADLVVGVGGGSAIDTAKALAALLANPGPALDYAEVIGAGKPLSVPSLPCVAVPTTAGTGSEVTKNAVLASPERRVKVSLRAPHMVPRAALVDPELCLGLPPGPTAAGGLDALTQLVEPFTCNRPNPLVDALCREAIPRAARSLAAAYRDGGDLAAREDLSLASLFSGMALANARLGAVHGIAAPLGGAFAVAHGAACAALLAPVTAANVAALRARDPGSPALGRYAEVAAWVGAARGRRASDAPARPEDAAGALAELAAELGVRGLASYGVGPGDLEDLARKAKAASSMQGNPIALEDEELLAILEAAL